MLRDRALISLDWLGSVSEIRMVWSLIPTIDNTDFSVHNFESSSDIFSYYCLVSLSSTILFAMDETKQRIAEKT